MGVATKVFGIVMIFVGLFLLFQGYILYSKIVEVKGAVEGIPIVGRFLGGFAEAGARSYYGDPMPYFIGGGILFLIGMAFVAI